MRILKDLSPGEYFYWDGHTYELIEFIRTKVLCRRSDDDIVYCFENWYGVSSNG